MAVGATTGPVPACSVCTSVAFTLKGAVTATTGAAVSVDPVTATLPVTPGNVHSGVPGLAGAAVGQVASGPAAWVTVAETAGTVEDLLADGVVPEPQAARVTANAAVQAPNATTEGRREKFTLVTLQRIDPAKVLAHTELILSKASDGVGKLLLGASRAQTVLVTRKRN